jgi:hypothetical protein
MKLYVLLTLAIVIFCWFASSENVLAAESTGHEHRSNWRWSFSLFSLVKPLGICALSSLLITFLAGLFRRKLGQRFLKLHMIFAFLTVIIALFHGILVLVLF